MVPAWPRCWSRASCSCSSRRVTCCSRILRRGGGRPGCLLGSKAFFADDAATCPLPSRRVREPRRLVARVYLFEITTRQHARRVCPRGAAQHLPLVPLPSSPRPHAEDGTDFTTGKLPGLELRSSGTRASTPRPSRRSTRTLRHVDTAAHGRPDPHRRVLCSLVRPSPPRTPPRAPGRICSSRRHRLSGGETGWILIAVAALLMGASVSPHAAPEPRERRPFTSSVSSRGGGAPAVEDALFRLPRPQAFHRAGVLGRGASRWRGHASSSLPPCCSWR
jgi:hypothetical protein